MTDTNTITGDVPLMEQMGKRDTMDKYD